MVSFDFRDVARVTKNLERVADQIPFAMAQALNRSADIAMRQDLPTTWSNSIGVRNPNFIGQALSTKGERATKKLLRVVVYDRFGRANLKLHDKGGTARARGEMAIPASPIAAKRGAHGVPKGMRPRALANSFAKKGKSGDTLVFQRTGKYQKATAAAHKRSAKAGEGRAKGNDGRHLRLAYVLKPSNPVRADVPFSATFEAAMRREMPRQFKAALKRALATARR